MQAHSYMGHRFPSSDIPQPARELYLRNKVRIINDINEADSPIRPATNPLNGQPIDLSDSRLRGPSLVHVEYLRNMGVRASLSFAITIRGELLGLIACHHFTTFDITQEQRNACELIAEAYAAHAPLLEVLTTYRAKFAFQKRLETALEPIRESADKFDTTESVFKGHTIADIFGASGLALAGGGVMEFSGITPRPAGISELATRLQEELRREIKPIIAISNLHERLPDLVNTEKLVAGVLAVRLKDEAILMIFRPEVIRTITWGGDPVKQLDKKGLRGEINPRKSFEAWKEIIVGTCLDWQPYEIEGAEQLAETLGQFRQTGGRH
jgi:chemotaxis family two-component system sensor kinase Cph1